MKTPLIDIRPDHWGIVRDILHKRVPQYEVWAFGSRAKWTAKEYSDLDLCVVSDRPLSLSALGALAEDFSESDLPWKVDVVDWAATNESFRKVIERDKVLIQEGRADVNMPAASQWRKTTLGAVTDWMSGGTPSKDESKFWNGEIPWISASSMKSIHLSDSELKITEEGLRNGSRLAETDTVLLLVRGSELHKRIPIGITTRPVAFNQDVKGLRPRNGLLPQYLLYWLLGNATDLLRKVEHTGIGAGKLDTDILKSLPLSLPSIQEQHAISDIVSTLDDKIELNRRMNETLEAMARGLFKSWFVDFDPVRTKAEGRDTGLPRHIADLFPDSFEDSELGEIPKGWNIGTLGDVAEHMRRSVQPNEIGAQTPYIALEHMPRRCIALSDWDYGGRLESNKFEFKRGEILFGKLRPYFHKVGIAPCDGVCSTDIVVVRSRRQSWFGFVLGHVSSVPFVDYTNAGATGTKMPRTSWNEMARFKIALPQEGVAEAYSKMIQPAVERIIDTIHEARNITAIRDILLPKLISGEIRVKAAAA